MKSTLHMRSTRHQFLSWCACVFVCFLHVLNKQNRTTWFWTIANGSGKANLGNRSRNCTANSPQRTDTSGFAGPHLGRKAGYPTAVAGSHPGSPLYRQWWMAVGMLWASPSPEFIRWVFGQVNWPPLGQIISGKCLLVVTPFLPLQSSLGIGNNGSKLHSL